MYRNPLTWETNSSVLDKNPEGSDVSRYTKSLVSNGNINTLRNAGSLTKVYHSMRRGNNGSGIVNAKRSSTRDRKTMVSTLAMVDHGELGELRSASGRYKRRDKVGRKLNIFVDG